MKQPISATFKVTAILLGLTCGFYSASQRALGYIPDTQFIFSEATKNHGKGPYAYETEVTFRRGTDTFVSSEKWIVDTPQRFSVRVSGPSFLWAAMVEGGRHISTDPTTGARESESIPQDLYESVLHTRTPGELGQFLTSRKFVAPDTVSFRGIVKRKDTKKEKEKDLDQASHPQIRLGRTNGVVTVAFGTPSLPDGSLHPMIWFDQDRFLIRKIRTPGLVEAHLSNHGNFARGFRYPRTQTLTINGTEITIQLKKMDGLNSASMDPFRDLKPRAPEGPLAEIVLAFYSRFR